MLKKHLITFRPRFHGIFLEREYKRVPHTHTERNRNSYVPLQFVISNTFFSLQKLKGYWKTENIHTKFGKIPSIGSISWLHLTLRAWNSKQEDWNSDPEVHLWGCYLQRVLTSSCADLFYGIWCFIRVLSPVASILKVTSAYFKTLVNSFLPFDMCSEVNNNVFVLRENINLIFRQLMIRWPNLSFLSCRESLSAIFSSYNGRR